MLSMNRINSPPLAARRARRRLAACRSPDRRRRRARACRSRNGSRRSAPRALARGISAKTYDRVMGGLKPDTSVYALQRAQPEFHEQTWQYLNRRVSDWRITTGKEDAKEHRRRCSTRIEKDYGVDRYLLLALWGVESAYGDPLVQQNYMRPVFPALAALAWGEPRRRAYWETGTAQRARHRRARLEHADGNARLLGRRHGPHPMDAGGLAQRRPRLRPRRPGVAVRQPDDALAGTARYLVERGKYRRGEHWGYEVARRASRRRQSHLRRLASRRRRARQRRGRSRIRRPRRGCGCRCRAGRRFLLGQNFYAVHSYNPSMNYTLAIVHLERPPARRWTVRAALPRRRAHADARRVAGDAAAPDQGRLRHRRRSTAGSAPTPCGRCAPISSKVGIEPADGYAGLKVLARLRKVVTRLHAPSCGAAVSASRRTSRASRRGCWLPACGMTAESNLETLQRPGVEQLLDLQQPRRQALRVVVAQERLRASCGWARRHRASSRRPSVRAPRRCAPRRTASSPWSPRCRHRCAIAAAFDCSNAFSTAAGSQGCFSASVAPHADQMHDREDAGALVVVLGRRDRIAEQPADVLSPRSPAAAAR